MYSGRANVIAKVFHIPITTRPKKDLALKIREAYGRDDLAQPVINAYRENQKVAVEEHCRLGRGTGEQKAETGLGAPETPTKGLHTSPNPSPRGPLSPAPYPLPSPSRGLTASISPPLVRSRTINSRACEVSERKEAGTRGEPARGGRKEMD